MSADKQFNALPIKERIKNALAKGGFEEMTEIQANTIPQVLRGKDVIVQSQTGSGKTLAYIVPLLNALPETASTPLALIIVPTRELCAQIKDTIALFGAPAEVFIGGSPIEEDVPRLSTMVCIATPGRLADIMAQHPNSFSKVRHLILDESDKLLDSGFESKLLTIISQLPRSRTTGLFSATINEAVTRLSQHSLKSPVTVKVTAEIPAQLHLKYVLTSPSQKIDALLHLVATKRAIVFFATCAEVDFFYALLTSYYSIFGAVNGALPVQKIHGKMNQKERSTIYEQFHKIGGMLLCTDVAARGIDFKDIGLVIHFDIPKDPANIIHRSGRTARNGSEGVSILFVMPNESAYIDFLKLKGITIVQHPLEDVAQHESEMLESMGSTSQDLAVRAFVCYFRSYKEHVVNYVLNYKQLDYDGLTALFFLTKIPSMPELRKVVFKNFTKPEKPANVDKTLKEKIKQRTKLKNKPHAQK